MGQKRPRDGVSVSYTHLDVYKRQDNYYIEGERQAVFLGERVTKYHRTLTSYVGTLLSSGFALTGLAEPQPPQEMVDTIPGMADELRRPMMLILAAKKR